ncbi:hypothetical protein K458DRAFT_392058 [Lentithecium fluviatile CBS 122367]|uniref:Methyltransferase domain-containing protein n=1 Tax=Lentithecium fluviatile CBS 122367 TaxID=1168545 RepID=A0A6G1ISN6_9PLEO|nr:hypothetical protein K458DRAFT_392058 [Lentithecium fluviatile CBS 122367]
MGRLLLVPIDFSSAHSLRILDAGTAAVRWLRDLQREQRFQHEYIGTDITESFFPPHTDVTYKVQDVTEPWPQGWADSPQLEDVVANLIGLLKPGGWIQLMESNVSEAVVTDNDNPAAVVWKLLRQIYLAMDVEPDVGARLRACFTRAGLVEVREDRVVVPIDARRVDAGMGKWSTETVALTAQQLALGVKHLGITSFVKEELEHLPSRVLSNSEDHGGTYAVYAIIGRRP